MPAAVVIDAIRTPIGKRSGGLKGWHAVDLAAATVSALIDRTGTGPEHIDDVIMTCTTQIGEQAMNVARYCALAAGLSDAVPGTTVDRQSSSFAVQAIASGICDVVIAGGVESSSRVPKGATTVIGVGHPFGRSIHERYASAGGLVPAGIAAELLATELGASRRELDLIALQSHERATSAYLSNEFVNEILPMTIKDANGNPTAMRLSRDESIRDDTEQWLRTLKPMFASDGVTTAGNLAQQGDSSAAILLMSEERASRLGLQPIARILDVVTCGVNPALVSMKGSVDATNRILERTKLAMDQVDLVELDETSSASVIAWQREFDSDAITNCNGGSLSLGSAAGATGVRQLTTLIHCLRARNLHYGLQVAIEDGGMSTATIVESI